MLMRARLKHADLRQYIRFFSNKSYVEIKPRISWQQTFFGK